MSDVDVAQPEPEVPPSARVSSGKRLGAAALILVASTIASRILGYLRETYVAAAFGADGTTDAFMAAFTIPDFFGYLLAGGALSITFIPIYTRHLTKGTVEEGDRVVSSIATLMAIILTVCVVALTYFAPQLVGGYLHKLPPEHRELATQLTRILLPAQIAFYLGGLASATLMARHSFVAASLAPLLYNLGTILGGMLLGKRLGIAALAWGTLAGALIGPFGIQVLAAVRAGFRYRPRLQLLHPDVKLWARQSLPLMVGVSIVAADEWIQRYFAAGSEGAISHLGYARKLAWVPIAVAGQAVGVASMPFFARLFSEGKRRELGELVVRTARGSAAIAALAAGGLAAVAVPVVDLLLRRGHFTQADVEPTALYLTIFALTIPLWAVQGIVARAFYATGDTWTPMLAGTAVTAASLPLYKLLNDWLGSPGLVIASDLAIVSQTAVLLLLLHRRVPEVDRGALLAGTLRAVTVAVVAAVPAHLAARYLPHGYLVGHLLDLARLGVAGLVFAAVALALAGPLGVTEGGMLVDKVRRRLRRQ